MPEDIDARPWLVRDLYAAPMRNPTASRDYRHPRRHEIYLWETHAQARRVILYGGFDWNTWEFARLAYSDYGLNPDGLADFLRTQFPWAQVEPYFKATHDYLG